MIDEKHFAQMIRSHPDEEKHIVKPSYLDVHDVSVEFISNHENKKCLKYKSPNLTFMCMSTSPIVSVERLDVGYRVVVFDGTEYLLLKEKRK